MDRFFSKGLGLKDESSIKVQWLRVRVTTVNRRD